MIDNVVHAPVTVYPSEKAHIENYIMSPLFPWFWQDTQTFDDLNLFNKNLPTWLQPLLKHSNGPYLSHTLLRRSEDENESHLSRPASDFSGSYEFFIEIFHRFMTEQNIKYSKIFRANLNLNWYNGINHTEPHVDHPWPHCNFIMYLNTCDQGQTILWPDDFGTSFIIPCKQYTAVAFKKQWHGHRYPTAGNKRVVFVVTYI
jgi:hypothetical protein